jgi:protein TonB
VILQVNTNTATAGWLLDPLAYWSGLDRPSRILLVSVALSILLHALLLTVHFRFPEALRWKSNDQPLEVTLVNAKSREAPKKARALAQANLDGGGNTEERARASSPLPAMAAPRNPGRDLADAQRRMQELEAQQQKLLAQARAATAAVAPDTQRRNPADEPSPQLSGQELRELSRAILDQQAKVDRQLRAYEERPRVKHLGSSAREYRFAAYMEAWRAKVEHVGTLNYPAEARGRLYGIMRVSVTILPDGSVKKVSIDRGSGLKVLDDAAERILKLAAPFAAFPPDIRKDTDELVITRSWIFAQGDIFSTKE